MTAQILQFAARSMRNAVGPQTQQVCQVISFAERREKRQRRLETSNVFDLNFDDVNERSHFGF